MTNTSNTHMTVIASNNVTCENIPDVKYNDDTVWGFDVYLAARLTATTNLYANYHIKGINRGDCWVIYTSCIGDTNQDCILSFNITDDGQLQYSTTNFTGFSSLIFKYKVITY